MGLGGGDLFGRGPLMDNSGAMLSDWKWIIDNGTSTTAENNVTNGTNTVYTVPAGKIYYVSYIILNFLTSGAGSYDAGAIVNTKKIMDLTLPPLNNYWDVVNADLRMPIKLTEGQTVQVHSSNASLQVSVSCSGYLLDA